MLLHISTAFKLKKLFSISLSGLILSSPLAFSADLNLVSGSYEEVPSYPIYKTSQVVVNKDLTTGAWVFNTNIKQAIPQNVTDTKFDLLKCQKNNCTAAGTVWFDKDKKEMTMIHSSDGGKTWAIANNVKNLPEKYKYSEYDMNELNCDQGLCFITGSYSVADNEKALPFLLRSEDLGKSWAFVNTSYLFEEYRTSMSMTGVKCNYLTCVSVARNVYPHDYSYSTAAIVKSNDGGKSWDVVSRPRPGDYLVTSDTYGFSYNRFNNRFYLSATYWNLNAIRTMLLISEDNSANWKLADGKINDLDVNEDYSIYLYKVECDKNVCIRMGIAGTGYFQKKLIMVRSEDGGYTWSNVKSLNLSEDILKSAYIDDVGAHIGNTWIKVGGFGAWNEGAPLIITSSDNGYSWRPAKLDISNIQSGSLSNVKCDKSHCIAVGNYLYKNQKNRSGVILESDDAGQTWQNKKIENMPMTMQDGNMSFNYIM